MHSQIHQHANDAISYSGVISWRQFWRAQLSHAKRRGWIILLFPVFMAASMGFWGNADSTADYLTTFIIFIWMVTLLIGLSVFQWWRIFTKTPSFKTPISGTVSRAGFTAIGSIGTVDMAWPQLVKVTDTGNSLLLFTTPYTFQLLCREFFASDHDWEMTKGFALSKRIG